MTNTVRIRKERFRQWLQTQKPNAIVGSTREMSQSPVANYVRERSRLASSRTVSSFTANDGRNYGMSGWVAEFLNSLTTHKSDTITARTALRLLN